VDLSMLRWKWTGGAGLYITSTYSQTVTVRNVPNGSAPLYLVTRGEPRSWSVGGELIWSSGISDPPGGITKCFSPEGDHILPIPSSGQLNLTLFSTNSPSLGFSPVVLGGLPSP
jgi:hypothetical protein